MSFAIFTLRFRCAREVKVLLVRDMTPLRLRGTVWVRRVRGGGDLGSF